MKPETIEMILPFVFGITVALFFYYTLRKASKKVSKTYEQYEKQFEVFKQKALSSKNPKYLHILYKQVYQIRKKHRREKAVVEVATEVMRFILERIDNLPKEEQQKYAQEHHHHHPHHNA